MSLDCSTHIDTLPSGSIVRRSTIWPCKRGVVAQLPVVQPVERRLVAVEHDLYFFVGAGRPRPAARLRPVAAADRGDRAGRAAYLHALQSASAAATATAAADRRHRCLRRRLRHRLRRCGSARRR